MKNLLVKAFMSNTEAYDAAVLAEVEKTSEYQDAYKEVEKTVCRIENAVGLDFGEILEAAIGLTSVCIEKAYEVGLKHGSVFTALDFAETMRHIEEAEKREEA